MKQFFKNFFSTSNEINENVVMGVIFALILLVATFIPIVEEAKYYVLGGAVLAFFGIGALKK
jgi:membrane protein CcdC involved in cytochrome C biogenesis